LLREWVVPANAIVIVAGDPAPPGADRVVLQPVHTNARRRDDAAAAGKAIFATPTDFAAFASTPPERGGIARPSYWCPPALPDSSRSAAYQSC
jgi:hypothetical protein